MKALCAKTSGSNMHSLFPSISELKTRIDLDSETLMSYKISQSSPEANSQRPFHVKSTHRSGSLE